MLDHNTLKGSPWIWQRRARGQIYVADLLVKELDDLLNRPEREPDFQTVALVEGIAYHYGMAVELAAKGALIDQSKEPGKSHKLLDLCKHAGLTLTPAERSLLKRLQTAVEWWGRYPVPNDPKKHKTAVADGTQSLTFPDDHRAVTDILYRLGVSD